MSWSEFKEYRQPTDEVWRFGYNRGSLNAGSGYALVRSGKIVAAYFTIIS